MRLWGTSNRALARESVRVIHPRRLLVPGILLLLILNLSTFAGGFWIGRDLGWESGRQVAYAEAADDDKAAVEGQAHLDEQFFIARIGRLVGRLKSLEADALRLRQMLGEHKALTQGLSFLAPPSKSDDGQGGVWLSPRGCAGQSLDGTAVSMDGLQRSEAAAKCLRVTLDQLMDGVAVRNAALMSIPTIRPVRHARLGSSFGNRSDPFNKRLAFHSGMDFSLHSGSDVLAAAGGRVRSAKWHSGYGKLLEIDHGNGLVTRYAHLSRFHVRAGDLVRPGQRIAAVGSTGRSTGPHLHFEVLHNGRFVDPQRFLALDDLESDVHAVVRK